MATKRQYQTIRRKKKSPIGLIVIILIVVLMVAGGAGVALFATANAVTDIVDSSGISLSCSVSGNDIIVTLFDGGRSNDIKAIQMEMQGYTLPPGYSLKQVPDGHFPKTIKYENVASGITGDMAISFRATFNDDTSKVIWMDTVRFT